MPLKVTTWNIKHTQRLMEGQSANDRDRAQRVKETIEQMDPDILLIVEGPKGEEKIVEFCNVVLDNQWVPVLLKTPQDQTGDKDRAYGHDMRGKQWMWYVVKPTLLNRCRIQEAFVWQDFIGSADWEVNYWGKIEREQHDHYRHPQVLIYSLDDGQEIEFIGVHLKSKINTARITRDARGNFTGEYLETALKARVKLATEARNLRSYVDAKFDQLQNPALVILGDCNDGPGHDLFESQYLFFDLIQNIQGEVLLAEKYFNHVLFDYAQNLRWTAKFRDKVLNIPERDNPLLLDHILISQPLCNGSFPLMVNAGGGLVEHQEFERANAGSNRNTISSDHRPVSVVFDENPV